MPFRSPHPCSHPGCGVLVSGRFCPSHEKKYTKDTDARRGSARARGYDGKWERARKAYLSQHPLCVMCEQDGRTSAATVVDHINPHRGDWALFWDRQNWQPLCANHHNSTKQRIDRSNMGGEIKSS